MKYWIAKIKEKLFFNDYIEFNRKLTANEKLNIHDYINGKKYMAHKPGTAPVKEKKGKVSGIIGSQGSFVI